VPRRVQSVEATAKRGGLAGPVIAPLPLPRMAAPAGEAACHAGINRGILTLA
jgi:hypothetical protein